MSSNRKFNTNFLNSKVKTLFNVAMSKKRLGKTQKETINRNYTLLNMFIAYYSNGDIQNIRTVENIVDKVDNLMKVSKVIINKINKIVKEIEDKKEKIKLEEEKKKEMKKLNEKKKLDQNFVKQRIIKLDNEKINNQKYGYMTNKIEFDRLRKSAPNCYYVQDIKFYNDKNQIINDGIFKNLFFDYVFKGTKQYKDFIKVVDLKMSVNGSDGGYKPHILLDEYGLSSYTIITSTAYKLETKDLNVDLNQLYQEADSGHCVFDAFLNYFNTKKESNRNAKSIYNKLTNATHLKKAYTDETINEIASFCNSTLKIKDLINGSDKEFKNDYARFYIELLNTKYNHLDLLQHTYNDIEEVDNDKLFEIKKTSSFYIEKNGLLITIDKTYKTKSDEFNEIFTEWKTQNNFNELYILEESDVYNMIFHYDNNLHTFFNKFEVNNELYHEIDLKKAYYNYSDITYNKFYNGVPTGSFINIKCNNNFTIETFDELYNNNLIGYFEVKIISHLSKSDHFYILGLTIGSNHIFTSAQINLLKNYIDFKFINASYAPSVHIPFNSKFLNKDSNGLRHYCKAYGLMVKSSSVIDITIKPLRGDSKYYNTIDNEIYDIYKVDGLVKISYKNKENKNFSHIANYIHSYTRTLIIDQILNMNINDIFGVKLDSIVIKKSSVFTYDDSVFGLKKANIESMLKSNTSLLDYGIDNILDDDSNENSNESYSSSHYKSYFSSCDENVLDFKESFLYSDDIIKNRVIFIGGPGGSGKTSSLLRNLNNKNICFTTSCWNLIQGQKLIYPEIMGFSIPNLTGSCGGYKTEKIKNNNIKYLIIDELTLIDKKDIIKIIDEYKNCYIFLLGDIDKDGFFYQCTLPTIDIFKPNNELQYINYTKSYRFDDDLNNKLINLRKIMKAGNYKRNMISNIYSYVKSVFKFTDKEDIVFNNNDVGISAINDFENNENELTNYFINKGTEPQYYIKTTNKNNGQLKGQKIDEKPTHTNYECKLFKTIHSFQGLDLNNDNKIIISITKNFDYNLFYTALSRARRCDQIIILNVPYKPEIVNLSIKKDQNINITTVNKKSCQSDKIERFTIKKDQNINITTVNKKSCQSDKIERLACENIGIDYNKLTKDAKYRNSILASKGDELITEVNLLIKTNK